MIGFILIIAFGASVIIALSAITQKKLPDSVILFMGVGLSSTIMFFIFQAPDVALTEAVIGTGVSAIVFLMALKHFGVRA